MKITNMKEFKVYIKSLLNSAIQQREKTRGTGVYLAENMDSYYINVGEIFLLQRICKNIGLIIDEYNPFETEEDDDKFNYCGASGAIGQKDGNNDR